MEDGIIDRLVVAVGYSYDRGSEMAVRVGLVDIGRLVALAGAAWAAAALEASAFAHAAADAGARLGMSAAEYVQWGYVVERTGANMEDLGGAMRGLQMQMAAAKDGSEGPRKALRELGLESDVLSGRISRSADLLPIMADRLADIEDPGRRAELTMLLMGEAGAKLAGTLAAGSAGIAELAARSDALNGVLDEEMVARSMSLNDAISDMGKMAVSTSRTIGFTLVPALERAATSTRDWWLSNKPLIDGQLQRVFSSLGEIIDEGLTMPAGQAAAAGASLATAWGVLGAAGAMVDAAAAASPLAAAIVGQAKGLGATALAVAPYVAALAVAGLAIDDLAVAADGGDAAILRLAESLGIRGETQAAIASTRDLLYGAAEAASALATAIGDGLAGAIERLIDLFPSLEPLRELAETLRGGVGGLLEGFAERNARAARGFDLAARALQGDPTVAVRERDFGGLAARSVPATVAEGAVRALPGPLSVAVNIAAGPTIDQIADAAGEEVRRQVLAAADAAR